jgi:hypothetical protein
MRLAFLSIVVFLLLLTFSFLPSSGAAESNVERSVFEIDVMGERFKVVLTEPSRIAEARLLMQSGEPRVLMGAVHLGDGGFNGGYSWHLAPASVGFHEVIISSCDASPFELEEQTNYWATQMKAYCPAEAVVVAEERRDYRD